MKTFQQATEIVAQQIKEKDSAKLFCFYDELEASEIRNHIFAAALNYWTENFLIYGCPESTLIDFYSQMSIAMQIGIAIGIEMEKPE